MTKSEGPHRLKQARWSFFWPQKTINLRVVQNQVQIDSDNENDDYYDDNGENFDDYSDENYQKTRQIPCRILLF